MTSSSPLTDTGSERLAQTPGTTDSEGMAQVRLRPAVLIVIGLVCLSGCDARKSVTSPGPIDDRVRYTAIGASDAIGYGGSAPCLPFLPCPNGTGYVQIIERRLRTEHTDVAVLNLGIPGAVLSREIMSIGNNLGRGIPANFIDAELPLVASDSTIVTVFGDGNGVNTIGAALRPLASADRAAYAHTQIQNFARDFAALTAGIAARAREAQIVVINIPNLARLPYATGYSAEERDWLRQLSVGFSTGMNATRSSQIRVVDLMCHAPIYQASLYSSDGFHPNDAGYAALADLVLAAVASAPGPPATTCEQIS